MNAKSNVYLIDPGTDSNLNLLPLAVSRIASYCRSLSEISSVFNLHVRWPRHSVEETIADLNRPVVVGLSCYVWNTQASLAIARAIRRHHPDCLIVLGGASVPKRDNRIRAFLDKNPSVDILVRGDGEISFANILRSVIAGEGLGGVNGIAFRHANRMGAIAINPPEEWNKNLDLIPSPFLNGIFDELLDRYPGKATGVVLESNRGCPYSCTFCDWGSADLHKIIKFDLSRVKSEIEWAGKNGMPYIFLADANFGILYERDLELADYIAKINNETGNPKFLGMNWTKNSNDRVVEIASRLMAGGVSTGVTLAAQSFHEPTLNAINRRNMKEDDIDKLRTLFHSNGIITYTDLILGLPEETMDSFLGGLERVMTPNLKDHWVLYLCNILENTEMAEPGYLDRYGLQTSTCKVSMNLREHDENSLREEEIIVVGTNTFPRSDWDRAYEIGYLCAALYNYRIGYFIMNFIKATFDIRNTEFISFTLDRASDLPEEWPALTRGINHLRRQRQMVLDGLERHASSKELGGFSASPQDALLAIYLENADAFYQELRAMTEELLVSHGLELETELLDDLFAYQQVQMTIWQPAAVIRRNLNYDLVSYFKSLQKGGGGTLPEKKSTQIEVTVPDLMSTDRFTHARKRTHGARYTDILEAKIV